MDCRWCVRIAVTFAGCCAVSNLHVSAPLIRIGSRLGWWTASRRDAEVTDGNARDGDSRVPSWQRQGAALARARQRAPRLSFTQLALRAARADRMIRGRLPGDAWDEMALLSAELCGRPATAQSAPLPLGA